MLEKIFKEIKRALRVLSGFPTINNFIEELSLFFEMILAYRTNRYRDISLSTLIISVIAVLYALSPIDILPDFIPFIGWIDDFVVLRMALELIRDDIREFRIWKELMESYSSQTN